MNLHFVGALTLAILAAVLPAAAAPEVSVSNLRCEYRTNPMGIDSAAPRLSWQIESDRRNVTQHAYQVLVATDPALLGSGKGDLWDSGRVKSGDSVHVVYAGTPLASGVRCYWSVRVWDDHNEVSNWSAPAMWSMGLLNQSDWKGKWIGLDSGPTANELQNSHWIWFPEGQPATAAPIGKRYFRYTLNVPADKQIDSARLVAAADNALTAFANGVQAGKCDDYKLAGEFNLIDAVHAGKNVISVLVDNRGDKENPAGLIGVIVVTFTDGTNLTVPTDATWRASNEEAANWTTAEFDDSKWQQSMDLGAFGLAPWGTVTVPQDRRLPARMLRRVFTIDKPVKQATAFISGVGLSELYVNGAKAGNHVMSPAMTEYNKRVVYVTHDVTKLLQPGANALGVWLGNGRFFAPRGESFVGMPSFGFPKLMLQVHVEFDDGTSQEIVSDEQWKMTADGPIRANNEYDGEEYDARKEVPGWSNAEFDDSKWQAAAAVEAPKGKLAAQMQEPIRVTETLHPRSMTSPKPGVYVFDMGQNMVGWCRLKVKGAAGTKVTLRHAETLRNGMLYVDNLRSAQCTDVYTLKGGETETYEPRFTYHGFRYVEVRGYPGTPDLSAIEGKVVHDDVAPAGKFATSNSLLNGIYKIARWGTRGNYRSSPTDCPQRDERQGWLGDRSAESRGEMYMFNDAAFYAKWVQDMDDAQKDTGSVPDVAPSYFPFYSDNVTWPSSFIIVPGWLYELYGDKRVLEQHYPAMKRWIDYMCTFIKDDLMPRDTYGDWCVPPESQELIHSKDPARKTAAELLGSTYFYYDLNRMATYAEILGHEEDGEHFEQVAEKMKTAFNKKYLNKELGQYDNGTQTSCVLPLAYGMVPKESHDAIVKHLVDKIMVESKGHTATGLIGGQWLMGALTDNGHADVGYTIATQTDYPSWGYMIEKGATTVWELWNGDTADPAMNSGNHLMLLGDVIVWFYERIGGIRPDASEPGFKKIIMKPVPVKGLTSADVSYASQYGEIGSVWKHEGTNFMWTIKVPANCTAEVHVPTVDPLTVREGGIRAGRAEGVKLMEKAKGENIYRVGSGEYTFTSQL